MNAAEGTDCRHESESEAVCGWHHVGALHRLGPPCSRLTHVFLPQSPALTAHMPDNRASAPNLPPELLIKIQRLAVSDMSPLAKLYSDVDLLTTTYSPLNDVELKPFLKARIFMFNGLVSF